MFKVSGNPDRSAALAFSGSTVSGSIYVFIDPARTSNLTKVEFYVDDPDEVNPALHITRQAPYDMMGTAQDGLALPFDTTQLDDGVHTFTGDYTTRRGYNGTVTFSFTVNNDGTVTLPPPADAGTSGGEDAGTSGGQDAGTGTTQGRTYPLHTGIVATTFWVGEIFDPSSPNGSQVFSAYDSKWEVHYGGCDGNTSGGGCATEARTAANDYFPLHMTPHENPFYLDLPFDDINNAQAFAQRGTVVPWANDPGYAGRAKDSTFSFMKNRWVKLMKNGHVCYAQNEDAGPAGSTDNGYDDVNYVFGSNDARPLNKLYNGAGMDVSPALNGCLGFSELNGENDKVDWQFVDDVDVPPGPWKIIVTTSGVTP